MIGLMQTPSGAVKKTKIPARRKKKKNLVRRKRKESIIIHAAITAATAAVIGNITQARFINRCLMLPNQRMLLGFFY
ncbi:hypothetical protein [Bacillus siamensis]|uniref:hypothetical protein n=1 Tax=Bacillus siamensis TaxID=659243 RepID=UPI0018E2F519|nr:hypothetical protein [Bacillus siamensis]MDU0813429.1 hypothetical protein [Bacillus siamensis]MED0772490.1 hypothetical protein [Bacillus siamensis]MED0778244.1 hypothetical protein [Bacillus siamensis]MED0835101.1 hypothetical protein [Bacillus siamensis]UZD75170.1 hypothetical protein OM992_05755 [Bacillus siamensis]